MQTLQSILSGRVKTATLHSVLSGHVKLAAGPAWYQDPNILAPLIGGGVGMLGGAGIGGLLGGGKGALMGGLGGGVAGAGLGYLGRDQIGEWISPLITPENAQQQKTQEQILQEAVQDKRNQAVAAGAAAGGAAGMAMGGRQSTTKTTHTSGPKTKTIITRTGGAGRGGVWGLIGGIAGGFFGGKAHDLFYPPAPTPAAPTPAAPTPAAPTPAAPAPAAPAAPAPASNPAQQQAAQQALVQSLQRLGEGVQAGVNHPTVQQAIQGAQWLQDPQAVGKYLGSMLSGPKRKSQQVSQPNDVDKMIDFHTNNHNRYW